MNNRTDVLCLDRDDGMEIEARYRRAKDALLQAQQENCLATYEFLAARAELRQLLEAVFPEPEITERIFN